MNEGLAEGVLESIPCPSLCLFAMQVYQATGLEK